MYQGIWSIVIFL